MAYLVPEILELLSSIHLHEAEQTERLVVGAKKEVKNLTRHLRTIKSELADAERRQLYDPTVKYCLGELNKICYELDDALEEWSTAILKSENEYASKPKRMVCSFFRFSSCFGHNIVVGLRPDIASKIKNVSERVDEIFEKEWQGFNFEKSIQQHITGSIIDQSGLVGREEEKERVINRLLSQGSQGRHLHVISIVGEEGIGKTSLAQLVYDDQRINDHFDERMWVHFSDTFEEISVAKTILSSRLGFTPTFNSLQKLHEDIRYSIEEKKFLLVLDDVREEDPSKWAPLMACLEYGLPGSKILLTTRLEKVGRIMSSTKDDLIHIGPLSMDDWWLLFTRSAFFGRSDRECENLEDIGREFIKKCQGWPLAAITLGGLLRFKKSGEEWLSVLNSKLWERAQVPFGDFICSLLLSSYDLPSKMRQCFVYCSTFPENYVFVKDELINLWMAQGYLRATQIKEMEMIGEEYFQNLAVRGFFQDLTKDENGSIITCKMREQVQDVAHDLARYLGQYGRARHLMMKEVEITTLPSFYALQKLRSLFIENEDHNHSMLQSVDSVLPDLLNQLTSLRTLKLRKLSIYKVPNEVRKLIHLRHLDLSYNYFLKELPETICELYYLQTLDLRGCSHLAKLPHGINRLINLRHLKNYGTRRLTFMPKGIERLSSLRELDEFVVKGSGTGDRASTLGDLRNLKLQKNLEIRGLGNEGDVGEAMKAQLKNKKHLVSLGVCFHSRETGMINDDKVIEALDPPLGLESLEIHGYRGITMFPSWMLSLTKLSKVCLSNFTKCKQLPVLGKLPSLESLEIKLMNSVEKVGHEFLGIPEDGIAREDKGEISSSSSSSTSIVAFPKLKELKFSLLKEWEEWEDWDAGIKGTTIMPCLLLLQIEVCPKLKALPVLQLCQMTALKELSIIRCSIVKARYYWKNAEDWNVISHIPIIKFDGERFERKQWEEESKDFERKANASKYQTEISELAG